jgi:hypothetical protein
VVPTETLLSVFAQFGRVMDLNLFRPYKGCRTSKVSPAGTHTVSTLLSTQLSCTCRAELMIMIMMIMYTLW